MFCPKCSQQQATDEMRFCSRCGFPLGGVALLLDNSGVLPESTHKRSPARTRMMSESAIMTGVGWGLAIGATLLFDYGGAFESVAKLGAGIFFILGLIGLLRFLYAFLVVKDLPNTQPDLPRGGAETPQLAGPERVALPVAHSIPISDNPRPINTKEMVPRPSVTEHTTRLLDD